MFYKRNDDGYVEPLPGSQRKTLLWGDKTLMVEFRLKKGAITPAHSHPHEQVGYLISGRIILDAAGVKFEALAGDAWCFPGNLVHSAEALEDCVAVEAFSPVREDYKS